MAGALGRRFGGLWAAYAASTFGTAFAFDALALISILVLQAGPIEVSLLKSAGLAAGAALAVPLGPWIEFRRKRSVMIGMDLIRFAAVISIPLAFALGRLGFAQLLIVSMIAAAADIAFRAASGAYLKTLLAADDLLRANARLEATNWMAIVIGPPLGGLAIGLFGPVTTVIADGVSYLLSAAGIRAIGSSEPRPLRSDAPRPRVADLFEGWRYILGHATLRPLFFNSVLVNGLIMATSPLLAVLMLGKLGFTPWQYGLAFGLPCIGGLIGARLARPLVVRFGQGRIMLVSGTLRACWSVGLAFIQPGIAGIALVLAVQFGLVTCIGIFNPVFATTRLEQADKDRVARMLSAWWVTSSATIALLTALWGLLASLIGPRAAIAIAGVLLLATPLLLFRREEATGREPEPAQGRA
jgi:hypothetical protein